jgi:ankyrin repeat protein
MTSHRSTGHQVDPNKEGPDGQTVFSRAAKEGDITLMKLLLKECKIDVNKVVTDTTTPLIQAVVANQLEAVKLLLAQPKINVGYVSQEGSALFLARALFRDAAIVKALAEHTK